MLRAPAALRIRPRRCRSLSSAADPYAILRVERGATSFQIKEAYRRMALKTHPDHNRSSPEEAERQFKSVTEAYRRISVEGPQASLAMGTVGCRDVGCAANWRPAGAAAFVWNDSMLPELFALLLSESGDVRLTQLYQQYVDNALSRRDTLLSVRNIASRDDFRRALGTLAAGYAREGPQAVFVHRVRASISSCDGWGGGAGASEVWYTCD